MAFTAIPEVKIISSPPNHTQPIAAAINLTCEARPRDEDELFPRRRVKYIQWYDTHGRQIGDKCLNPQLVEKLKCPLILKNLTIENFGNYTCKAENGYAGYCTRKSVEILLKGKNQIIPYTNKFGQGKYLLSWLFLFAISVKGCCNKIAKVSTEISHSLGEKQDIFANSICSSFLRLFPSPTPLTPKFPLTCHSTLDWLFCRKPKSTQHNKGTPPSIS